MLEVLVSEDELVPGGNMSEGPCSAKAQFSHEARLHVLRFTPHRSNRRQCGESMVANPSR